MRLTPAFIVILSILIFSCKPALITSETTELSIDDFRKQQKSFVSSEGTIKYIDQGEGEVILLMHGVPTSSWLYRKMIDSLSTDFRVIAPDMLGFGNSDSPKGYDIYAPHKHAERTLALMDSLQIETWTQVFHDAGGLWTWEMYKIQPQRMPKMVMLNSISLHEGFQPPIRFKRGIFAKIAMSMYSNGITTDVMLKNLFNDGLYENILTENEYQGYKKPLREGKTKAMYQFFSSTCNDLPDYSQAIDSISAECLVIWGKHDPFLKLEPIENDLIASLNLPKENVHYLEAGHFLQEEKPNEIVQLIKNFQTR